MKLTASACDTMHYPTQYKSPAHSARCGYRGKFQRTLDGGLTAAWIEGKLKVKQMKLLWTVTKCHGYQSVFIASYRRQNRKKVCQCSLGRILPLRLAVTRCGGWIGKVWIRTAVAATLHWLQCAWDKTIKKETHSSVEVSRVEFRKLQKGLSWGFYRRELGVLRATRLVDNATEDGKQTYIPI